VLEGGRLVEQGTHAALLAHNGVYAGLYHTQFRSDSAPNADGAPAQDRVVSADGVRVAVG